MSQISAEASPGMQQIDLMKLNLSQLTTLKTQLDNVRKNKHAFAEEFSSYLFIFVF